MKNLYQSYQISLLSLSYSLLSTKTSVSDVEGIFKGDTEF